MRRLILTIAIIVLGCDASFALTPSPASSPGTRVVPVIRTMPDRIDKVNINIHKDAGAKGAANVSQYITPEFDKTLGTEAAIVWTFGVLGGNREYLYAAPDIFKTGADAPRQDKVTSFLTLREQLYPATAWSIGNAQLMSVDKQHFGYDVKVLGIDIEPLRAKSLKQISEKYPKLSKEAKNVLAEWHLMYKLRDEDEIKKLRHTTISKNAPINSFGKISFGSQGINQLLNMPAQIIIEISNVLEKTPKWAVTYMDAIRFLVAYSGNVYFSPELRKALDK